ncbi:tetraacyldisaccharide 4'-kinase [uncultured Bacteroides sp.]|uniref:tetraacyldisaccharide 4'-kinase n=1 Tax=uncultured Bacteroides sp. TaxID=162156 RepID=UPI00263228B9|nr:tetraacyldisaccharide 4'-kinase [uncultured Bacteroides sp.]
MAERSVPTHRWLLPLSWMYGGGVWFRNKLFDWKILPSKSFDVPVICIGNLTAGGTGKTPHTEYLIRLLQQAGLNVAVLSRGYKRKSKGYILADAHSNAARIGDEPYQMKEKFPQARIAVDADRCHGIGRLLELDNPRPDVILLDDAFQHRYVQAGLNILLTDYNRLFTEDCLLPAGRLRESASGKTRAQIVIVTKCPQDIKPIDLNITGKRLNLYPYQQLYFTRIRYGMPAAVFPQAVSDRPLPKILNGEEHVLLVTGIASPQPLAEEVKLHARTLRQLSFSDHHDFSRKDMKLIEREFSQMEGRRRLILTTEKDAARLKAHPALSEDLKPYIYAIPIEVEILLNQQEFFNQKIIGYVRKNSRNGSLPQK